MTGTLDFGSITGRAITITADSGLDGADASIYLGNSPSDYGFDITYEGTGSGNSNAFVITSTNSGSPKELIRANQDGIVNLPQLGAKVANNTIFHDAYHPNADKWTTARTLSLTGDVTGSTSWDGSGNASITAVVADDSHNHVISNVDGLQTALDGKLSTSGKAADSDLLDGINSGSFLRSDANDTKTGYLEMQDGSANYIALGNSGDFRMWHDGSDTYFRNYNHPDGDMIWQTEGTGGTVHTALIIKGDTTTPRVELYYDSAKKLETTSSGVSITGTATATTFSGSLSGNASTATTLQTARTINGVSFDGSANITVEPYISNDDTGDTNCPIVFTANSTAGYKRLYEDSALYFNNTSNILYSGKFSGDGSLLTNVSATTASGCIYENSQTITANYTMTTNKNGMSAGPITINSGITVTIPSGSAWTVV
jgi:hypothetical protein